MMIAKNKLIKLVEEHFERELLKENYEVKTIKPLKILTNTRFDLAFKLFYLDMKDKNNNLAKKIYTEHIRAFSLGKFQEPENKEKNSIDKFIKEFDKTFEDIKLNGFNQDKTLIPLSVNGSIANGAHRVSSAIHLNKEVNCVEIDTSNHIYDYNFFYQRKVSENLLDMVATKFIEYAHNVYIAFIWPIGIKKDEDINNLIPNIVYKKTIKLSTNGAHNLLSQIYYGEEWLGNVENNFSGVNEKLIECFKTFDSFEVIAFQVDKFEDVLKIKEKIRAVFKIGKHSVHITDTKEEAIRVSNTIFNKNTLHFLNYAKPNKYKSTHIRIEKFKEFLTKNSIEIKDAILDSGMILSAYGLRVCSDIDYFVLDNNKITSYDKELEYHDEELKYHDEKKINLLYDSKNYFYFNNVKFISFNQLYKMKKSRAEEKDLNDCRMMEGLLENNKFKEIFNKIKQKVYYAKIKLRSRIIEYIKVFGLYSVARKIYRNIKAKNE